MIRALDISGSALAAQRVRMDVIASNMANAEVTHQEDGTPIPYRRRIVTFEPGAPDGGPGVRVAGVLEDPSEFNLVQDESHPDAIREGPNKGYVQMPNVSLTTEYVDAISASRAYEANAAMMTVTRAMLQQAIRLFA